MKNLTIFIDGMPFYTEVINFKNVYCSFWHTLYIWPAIKLNDLQHWVYRPAF